MTEKRWNVYHGSDFLGVKTAKEIREALRLGTLDPFDKVALEGSSIREELIDVDAIFAEKLETSAPAQLEPQKKAQEATIQPAVDGVGARRERDGSPVPPMDAQSAGARAPIGNRDSTQVAHRGEGAVRGAQKKYYLIDGSKVLGPLSALEIQALFTRKLLHKKVRVQKIGSEKTLAVSRFVESYAGDRLKELAGDGHVPQQLGLGSPSSRVLNELARVTNSRKAARDRRNIISLLLALVMIFMAILAYLLLEQANQSRRNRSEKVGLEDGREADRMGKASKPRLVRKPSDSEAKSLVRDGEKVPSTEGPSARRNARSAAQKMALSRKAASVQSVPVLSLSGRIATSDASLEDAQAKAGAAQGQPSVVSTEVRLKESSSENRSVIAKAMAASGRMQTVGPLSFSLHALEDCAAKCVLTFQDATGATMKVIFFKKAYREALAMRSNGVYLTGSTKIERNELILFLQDVR